MTLDDLPVLEQVSEWGADDTVFDALLLLGPVIIVGIRLVGLSTGHPRTILTEGIVLAYIAVLLGYILHRAIV